MINLIKYEFIKTRKILVISAEIIGALELMYILSSLIKWEFMYTVSAVAMALFTILPILFPLLYSIYIYDMDISRRHNNGYMIFMTANSPYRIIGAKLSASMLICIALLLVINLEGLVNSRLPAAYVQKELIDSDILKMIAGGMLERMSFFSIFLCSAAIAVHTANMICAVYFAKMLGDTVFTESEHKNALVFGIGAALLAVSGIIVFIIAVNAVVKSDITENAWLSDLNSSMTGVIVINLIFSALEYYGTSELCSRKFEML